MKLIIDISDKMFDTFKKHGIMTFDNLDEYDRDMMADAIATGTPYNPSGDCISREDLKKEFDKECQCDCSVCEHSRFDSFKGYYHCGLIDNAPTVETRPKGKWINHRNDYGHNIADCSLCGKAMQWHDEDEDGIPRFCWYCGADMKGSEENG